MLEINNFLIACPVTFFKKQNTFSFLAVCFYLTKCKYSIHYVFKKNTIYYMPIIFLISIFSGGKCLNKSYKFRCMQYAS